MARARRDPRDVMAENARPDGDCLIWTGSATRDGYGVLGIGRLQFRAHRIAYEAAHGEPADGRLVCHRCDRPLCIAPAHLFLGTPAENTRDMHAKGRANIRRGADHHACKILPEQRPAIRAARAAGANLTTLAAQYGVDFRTIHGICTGANSYAAR